ncbi:MAG: adenylate/guanylate cyclase domain-containing protein [Hyphomicrobiales bacterium]|nr:adenylate/guanylate cyclase domain-containing protein [Hyphomicrobiales bacterium]
MKRPIKRRLTCVLSADVKSYTRLMETDEPGTLDLLREYRKLMADLIERHEGRIVNTWGDAVIAEFASAVEAVQCAVEIQRALSERNGKLPGDHQMQFRIGINLGDIMVDGDDIYGEGVNIAARLQELAEPGGILISRPVYDQVHTKLAIGFDYLGEKTVKNVSEAVSSYSVRVGGRNAPRQTFPRDRRPAETGRQTPRSATPSHSGEDKITAAWNWYRDLPKPISRSLALIGFFFLINLFGGLHTVWFHWPSLPLVLIILLYYARSERPSRR